MLSTALTALFRAIAEPIAREVKIMLRGHIIEFEVGAEAKPIIEEWKRAETEEEKEAVLRKLRDFMQSH